MKTAIRSPIESIIDSVVSCTKCGAKMGKCDCWVSEVKSARCPHCGGKAVLESQPCKFSSRHHKEKIYMAEVSCTNQITCGARVNVFLNDESAARAACLEQWNRRT